ncbi:MULTISPECIES: tyrosine-type recombinase/integrase [Burkholderia]|uniref:tyrosine-type recombinase/integrase n=1 Tax=Burkholderia TaxID=32008 RepID=UPI000F549AC2|nr:MULTISPECIES: site-specific integrase [Burkholderia]RQM59712.1 site-specific integrase [Burkholderia vietnamiensis]
MTRSMFSDEGIEAALKDVGDSLILEDAEEDALLTQAGVDAAGEFVDGDEGEEPDDVPAGLISLADIPVEEWDSIAVSPLSRFGDGLWNFTCYPHVVAKGARLNFDYVNALDFNITTQRFVHWLRISKALLFYQVPHFAVSIWIRSYGSMASRKTRLARLFQLFNEESLYLGAPGDTGFRTINDLSVETVLAFIENLPTSGAKWEIAWTLRYWRKLSASSLLPPQYAIHDKYIDKATVGRYREAYDNASTPFSPIPLDDYAEVVVHCLRWVNDYGDDVLWLFRTFFRSVVSQQAEQAKLRLDSLSLNSREGLKEFAAYTPALVEGKPWWPLGITTKRSDGTDYLDRHRIMHIIASLMDASCTLILATTGMRRSEVVNLRSGCVSRTAEGPWLRFAVFKTSHASQGDTKVIPIPEPTARAIELLEALSHEARMYGGHDYLFAVVAGHHFGNRAHLAYPERAVKRVARITGVDASIHPHRFRKSLAMYLIYQDPRNIELIRHLFSHKSLKMTLRYILALPGVHTEIKQIIIDQNVALLTEVVGAVFNNKIGGVAGLRARKTIKESAMFKAKLQDAGKETLVQYVESMLDQGISILHRTNLGICMKTPATVEPSPCGHKFLVEAPELHPTLYACDPLNCRFAVFTERHVPVLESEIVFHQKLVVHPYAGEQQKAFSERIIKHAFARLREIDSDRADDFLRKLANG